MILNTPEEVGESFGAHEDNLLLAPGLVYGQSCAYPIGKGTYRHGRRENCPNLQGIGRGGPSGRKDPYPL